MAVNVQQRGLLQVATSLQQKAAPSGPQIGRLPSGGGEAAIRSEATAYASIANDLGKVASQVGAYADHAAAVEGRKEGHLAGMDPEFRPRNDGTIRGEAFDRAGLETMKSNIVIGIAGDVSAAKTADEIEAKRSGWLSKVPPELQPEVSILFSKEVVAKRREEARAAAARASAEATASLQGEIETLTKGLQQRAYSMGLDATATAAHASDLSILQARLRRSGPDGKPLVTPEAAQRILKGARETVADAQFIGAFERLPNNAEREAFLKQIEADFAASKGIAAEYDFNRFERLQGRLRTHLNIARSEERQQRAVVQETIGRLEGFVSKGDVPTDEQLAQARTVIAATDDPGLAARMAALEDDAAFVASARVHSLAQLERYGASLEQSIREQGPDERKQRRRDLLKKVAGEMGAAIKADPLGWEEKVGLVRLQPIDVSSPETAAATFTARIAQAEEAAKRHGIAPRYLRPSEAAQLSAVAAQGGQQMLDVAQRIATGAGDRAPAIMGEIAKHAPVTAHLGEHVRQLGATAVAADAANGLAMMKMEGFKGRAPSVDRAHELAVQVHKQALSGLPEDESALVVATNAAYEVRAQRSGITQFDDRAAQLWKRTFLELLGQRTDDDGAVYGGITAGRRRGWLGGGGGHVVVPPNIKQDQLLDLVGAVRVEDFGDAPPRFEDGRVASERDLRGASLTQAGDGRYWLNIGSEAAPVYLRDSVDRTQPFVLDVRKLEPMLRERKPEAFFGGPRTAPRPPGMMRLGGPQGQAAPLADAAPSPAPADTGADLPDGTPQMVIDGLAAIEERLKLSPEQKSAFRNGLYSDQALQTLEQVMQAPSKRIEEFHAQRLLDLIERQWKVTQP